MKTLNLKTSNKAQEQIKHYLEENASDILADKINNGVKITKENKTLLNKKDLDGFWKFATNEARKQAEKGANGAYIEDETVFGWAIHYFEEDSIEGNLFNEDGSAYKVETKKPTQPKIETQPKKPQNTQPTLFDLMQQEEQKEKPLALSDKDSKMLENIFDEEEPQKNIVHQQNYNVDLDTGEIVDRELPFDIGTAKILFALLDGKIKIKE